LGAQSENLDMNTHKIVGLVDPTADQEAATKKYVDDNDADFIWGDSISGVAGDGLTISINTNANSDLDLINLDTNNTNSANNVSLLHGTIDNNAGAGINSGIFILNNNTSGYNWSATTIPSGTGLHIYQGGAAGTAMSIAGANNVNTAALVNLMVSDTQSGASKLLRIDIGAANQAIEGIQVTGDSANAGAIAYHADMQTGFGGDFIQCEVNNVEKFAVDKDGNVNIAGDTILGVGKYLYDADKDTGICVEETSDKDEIVAKTAGVEVLRVEDTGNVAIKKGLTLAGTVDGWIGADETWTYASATTFTITGDKTSKYQKGDKIKLTQTTAKYFYIIGVSYSSPNTIVTITGGIDYTLVNASIASPYYSKIENPQSFPGWFNYTSSYSAAGSMTYTSVNTDIAKFRVEGTKCSVMIGARGTTGGTANTYISISLTINTSNNVGDFISGGGAMVYDSGSKAGIFYFRHTEQEVRVEKYDGSNWGLGAVKDVKFSGFYEIE